MNFSNNIEGLAYLIDQCKKGKVIRKIDQQLLTEPELKTYPNGRMAYDFTVTSKKTGKTGRQDYWIDVLTRYVEIVP